MIHKPSQRIAQIIGGWLVALLAGGGAPATTAAELQMPDGGGYEFGRGLRLGDSGFTLGGYSTVEYRHEERGAERLKSSHASAFIWWEGGEHYKAFGEVDLLNATERSRGDGSDADRRFSLERLYFEVVYNDLLTARLGKFLTPIGRWNPMHADPLVWTSTQPLLMRSVFPHNLTGVMASGQLPLWGSGLGYDLYASNGGEWRADPGQDPFSMVRGGRLVLPLSFSGVQDLRLGASYARYQQQRSRGDVRKLAGVDLFWSSKGWELSAEWLRSTAIRPALLPGPAPGHGEADAGPSYAPFGDNIPAARSAYLQGVMPLGNSLYAVARLDWSRDPSQPFSVRQSLLGLAWRPTPGASIKLEWLQTRLGAAGPLQGLVASASVLF